MSVTVTSHVRLFPRCHGLRVSQSGRFPSVRDCLGGSKTDGVLVLVSARCIIIIIIIIPQIYNARNVIITILKHHKMNLRRERFAG